MVAFFVGIVLTGVFLGTTVGVDGLTVGRGEADIVGEGTGVDFAEPLIVPEPWANPLLDVVIVTVAAVPATKLVNVSSPVELMTAFPALVTAVH